ncbi:MAG TPA: hypothetical protein VM165_11065, partial [Planctomycetaceae bacterium]|nr:hypothetical protein [Planctomycetaceae bacterium]
DYIGPAVRHGRNRVLSRRSGLVGLAMRTGDAQFATPPKNISTQDYLMRLGFSREESATMSLDRRSWAAIPIGIGPGQVAAILYADAKSDDFFGRNSDNKRKIIQAAASAVAKHLAPP